MLFLSREFILDERLFGTKNRVSPERFHCAALKYDPESTTSASFLERIFLLLHLPAVIRQLIDAKQLFMARHMHIARDAQEAGIFFIEWRGYAALK